MTIEFRCPACDALLRVPADVAGRQAKCPKCASVTTIPEPPAGPPETRASSSDNPFAAGPPPVPSPTPFAAGTGGDPNNPYRSPADYGAHAEPGQATAVVATPISLEDVFRRAWGIFKERMGFCIGVWFLALVVTTVAGYVIAFSTVIVGQAIDDPAAEAVLGMVGNVVNQVFSIWITVGQISVFIGIARGREVSLGELFSGGPYLLRAIGGGILYVLAVVVGLLLLIVPGIIFALMFSQFFYLIVDRNVGVIQSLEMSRQITSGNKLTLFAIGFVIVGLVILAALPCFLGLIFLLPFTAVLYAVIYLTMSGQPTAEQLRYDYSMAPGFAG